ncbi:MAG: hypothetical protein ACRC0L_04780 [Angustibacter sp.]
MIPHPSAASRRIVALAGCTALIALGACSTKQTPTANPFPTESTSPSASTISTEEADKAAITKVHSAYAVLRAKLNAGKSLTTTEINAVSTGTWRAHLTKRAKINPEKWTLITGPTKDKIYGITVTGNTATLMQCRDTTQAKAYIMPTRVPLESTIRPFLSRITFTKSSGTWLMSNLVAESNNCEIGE